MTFAKELKGGLFPITLEITPPKTSKVPVLLRRASLLGDTASGINIINRNGRQPSLAAAIELQKKHLEPIWHLTVGGKTQEAIRSEIKDAKTAGLQNVLCLLGDSNSKGELKVHEVIKLLKQQLAPSLIAVAYDQYHDTKNKYANLKKKIAQGATCIWTQPVLESKRLQVEVEKLKEAHPEASVVAMAMPLIQEAQLKQITARLQIPEQPALEKQIRAGEDEAWDAFNETVLHLVMNPYIDGLAIMTFETDPHPNIGKRIKNSLKTAKASLPRS